jgi:hypothetical protein
MGSVHEFRSFYGRLIVQQWPNSINHILIFFIGKRATLRLMTTSPGVKGNSVKAYLTPPVQPKLFTRRSLLITTAAVSVPGSSRVFLIIHIVPLVLPPFFPARLVNYFRLALSVSINAIRKNSLRGSNCRDLEQVRRSFMGSCKINGAPVREECKCYCSAA